MARSDPFGTASDFEKSRQDWAKNHPDNQGPKPPVYRPPSGKSNKITRPNPLPKGKLPPKKIPGTGTPMWTSVLRSA